MDATREPLPSEVPTVSEVDEDWRLLREAGDRRARDRLIVHYLPFARMLAAKVFSRRTYEELEFADYLQFASVGLIEAVDRFDPARGRFESFAGLRINGAILNGVTGLTERQQQVDVRRRMLESRAASLKESPELSDGQALFDHLADMAIGLAVGFVLDGSGMYRVDDPAVEDNAYRKVALAQLRMQLASLVETLPGNERKVIAYHYLQQIPFEQIATMLALSRGRISQLHKAGLCRLKASLGDQSHIDLSV
jgi:RNA polymerase sigma factor FliA